MQAAQHKKLYENALSCGQSSQSLRQALNGVLRLAIADHSHFNFLLHNINWFHEPYLAHVSVLEKALRLYRGRGKESEKVAYNMLADGMWSEASSEKACQCLINLIKPGFDHKVLKESLRENYPHKLTQLSMHNSYLRSLLSLYRRVQSMKFEILEIILVELACFDTELCTGDLPFQRAFPIDSELRAARYKMSNNADHSKFDHLITTFLEELAEEGNPKLFQQLLLIFKNDLVMVQQTKYVQFVLYYFAERGRKESKDFVTFLLCEIIENKANRKVLASVANYLASYISRSASLTPVFITKTVANLIKIINETLDSRKADKNQNKELKEGEPTENNFENVNLASVFEDSFDILLLLQSVLWIWRTRPECWDLNREGLKGLLQKCEKEIYYKYFIHHELLNSIDLIVLQEGVSTYKCLEIVHKFDPPLLKKLSHYIDPLIKPYGRSESSKLKLEPIKAQVKLESIVQGIPSKRIKSEKRESQDTRI